MNDYEREQRREVERQERIERETVEPMEPMDEPVGVYDRGERLNEPVMGREDVERVGERVDPYDRVEGTVGSSSGLWLTVGIIVLVVIALIVVMLLLPLL